MQQFTRGSLFVVLCSMLMPATVVAAPEQPGTEEFGLTPRQLTRAVAQVESAIASCMRNQGFQYIPADYLTVRKGMSADKRMPGLSEDEFIAKYGFGVATLYTGEPPQLSTGYSPARVGLGPRNVQVYQNLSPTDRVAYNRALFGDNPSATFAVGLEIENFSQTGGCTRTAIEQVFTPEQMQASYYNPKDAMINKDPRMKRALEKYAKRMRKAGFDYSHPDDVENDLRERLAGLTEGGRIPVAAMTAEQRAALSELQDYERRVAALSHELAEEIFDPVEEAIEKEKYARDVN